MNTIRRQSKGQASVRRNLFYYELRNVFGNWFALAFGGIFPWLMAIIISRTALSNVPDAYRSAAVTGVVLSFAQLVPMAGIFLGHTATYAKELEDRVPVRMQLFGFLQRDMLLAKMQAQLVFQTIALTLHFALLYPILRYDLPSPGGLLGYLLAIYVLAMIYFVFAHGIANFFCKFGPAYGVSMLLYFVFMILGGMMGIQQSMLPAALARISQLLPPTLLSQPAITSLWTGGGYNFAPLAQAMLFFGALAFLVLCASFFYRRNRAY